MVLIWCLTQRKGGDRFSIISYSNSLFRILTPQLCILIPWLLFCEGHWCRQNTKLVNNNSKANVKLIIKLSFLVEFFKWQHNIAININLVILVERCQIVNNIIITIKTDETSRCLLTCLTSGSMVAVLANLILTITLSSSITPNTGCLRSSVDSTVRAHTQRQQSVQNFVLIFCLQNH